MAENAGYGQMTPMDTTEMHNVIRFIVSQMFGTISTVRLVKVTAVHPGAGNPPAMGTVDVQPLVNMIDGNSNATEHKVVNGIPVVRLAAGSNAFVIDPVVGDIGLLLVCDRDISAVKENKDLSNPSSFRKFNMADGIYLGGILGDAPGRYFQFKSDGNFKLADAAGNVLETGPTGFVLTGNVLINGQLAFGGGIGTIAGIVNMTTVNVSGQVTANIVQAPLVTTPGGITLNGHHHGGVTTGVGNTGPAVP